VKSQLQHWMHVMKDFHVTEPAELAL
jgi:hypothetical protein